MTASKQENLIKSRLTNIGDGALELKDDAVKFYTETGRFKKQRKLVREIPFTEVENVERKGNDLVLTWKDTIVTFSFKKPAQLEAVYERINGIRAQQQPQPAPESAAVVEQKPINLTQVTLNTLAMASSLFEILRNLNGRINWKLVENTYKRSEETAGLLATQETTPLMLDVKPLSAAIQAHQANETAEKTYELLKALHDEFNKSVSSVTASDQAHPTPIEAKMELKALYLVNDMLLGAVVGDEKTADEGVELLKALEDLAKSPDSKIDFEAAKAAIDQFSADKGKQTSLVETVRLMLEQQVAKQAPIITPAPEETVEQTKAAEPTAQLDNVEPDSE